MSRVVSFPLQSDGPATDAPQAARLEQLRLRPGAHVFEISAEQLQIVFANYTTTFTSPPVTKGIRAILAALQPSSERVETVRQAAEISGLDTEFIDYLIDLLLNTKCLYCETKPAVVPAGQDTLAEFYAYLGDDPSAALMALATARCLVVAPAASSGELAQLLHTAGLAAEMVAIPPSTSCAAALSQIEAHIGPAPPMLVSWNFPYRLPFARLLNDLALVRSVPILFGACEGVVGRIGPYVIPRNTACLECCNSRLLAHAGSPELQGFAEYRAKYHDVIPAPWPTHPVFHDAMAGLFAIELSQIVMKRPPRTIGGFIEHSFFDSAVQRHPVYKLPRCPACHPARPQRIAWDARFPAPMVKDRAE